MAWCLEKFPNKCIIRGAKTRYKQNVPKKTPSKFHPYFARSNHVWNDFPHSQGEEVSPFFVRVAILQFEDLVPGDRVSDGLQVQVPSKMLYGEAIHPFMKSEWGRPFFWLSSCVLVEFIPSKFCLQIVRSSKIPTGFLKHHMFGGIWVGAIPFFCRPWQQLWVFTDDLGFFPATLQTFCTQQNTKGTEWESPSCRPVSHNSTRTSGRMQKSVACFCLEKMKPEKLRKKMVGETKKAMNSMCFCS